MSRRSVIVVDVETTNLDVRKAEILEVAAMDLVTGETLEFVPYVPMRRVADADPNALAVNRYFERRLRDRMLSVPETARRYAELADMLGGATLAGANPRYDAALLSDAFEDTDFDLPREPWHYRFADLSAYTAGALGLDPGEIPSLMKCCELLGVPYDNNDAHSALYDVTVTAECFRVLERSADARHSVSIPAR